jgi:hypothetical protein
VVEKPTLWGFPGQGVIHEAKPERTKSSIKRVHLEVVAHYMGRVASRVKMEIMTFATDDPGLRLGVLQP